VSEFRILVTGSREWVDRVAIHDALATTLADHWVRDGRYVLVHGGARGADHIADRIWRDWIGDGYASLLEPEVHYADWERYGKRAGMVRNAEMVNAGADVCLAFPLGVSVGTRGCMDLAKKAGIPVVDFEDPSS
jgi:hypothetical protein